GPARIRVRYGSDGKALAAEAAGADRRETPDPLGSLSMDRGSRSDGEHRAPDRIRERAAWGCRRDRPGAPDGVRAHIPFADSRLTRIPIRRRGTPRTRSRHCGAAYHSKLRRPHGMSVAASAPAL